MKSTFRNIFLFFLTSMLIYSCARNPVTGKKELMLMSESQELAMGKESDPAIIQAYGLYEDQELQQLIQQKGEAMAAISHRPDLDFHFRLLDSPVVNAFAVPGGYVYFTRGIMAHFNNEAQFAGVLGHEIGHITARHSAKQYSQQMLAQIGFMAGMIASDKFRDFAEEASQGLGLLFLKFGRDHESQSDELGVEYSTAVGYDAHEMADFFETLNRLQQKAGVTLPDFLSTHPNPANRYTKVHNLAKKAQKKSPLTNFEINREGYLNMLDGMIYGEDPKQGYTDNYVFYHPELLFQFPYPNGWLLQNAPTQVQIAPQDGKALIIMTLASENSLDAAAQAATQKFNLSVIESQRTQVNGNPAIALLSDQLPDQTQTTQQTEPIRILSYFIQYDNLIYVFHGLSLQSDFNQYSGHFKNTMTKFRKLTDPARINVQPTRLEIKAAPQSGTLATVLKRMGESDSDLEELAIINGLKLDDQIDRGYLLKTFSQRFIK